jgi:hypothetical protein
MNIDNDMLLDADEISIFALSIHLLLFIDYFIQKMSLHVASDFAQSNESENNAELSQVFKTMLSFNSFISTFYTVNTFQFFKFIKKIEKILINAIKKAANKKLKNVIKKVVNKKLKNERKKKTVIEKKNVIYEADY